MQWIADLLPLLHALEFCVWLLAAVGLLGGVAVGVYSTVNH